MYCLKIFHTMKKLGKQSRTRKVSEGENNYRD